MLVKIKEQYQLSNDVLNQDNEIKGLFIDRQGINQYFSIDENQNILLNLFSFDNINDVVVDVVTTSTVERTEIDNTKGNYIITSEDGSTRTYGYVIEIADYSLGLPIIEDIKDTDGVFLAITTPLERQNLNNQIFNVGVISKVSSSDVDTENISVFGGGATILSETVDYIDVERKSLYNGVDTYLKVFKNSDENSTDYENFAYYLIVENENLFSIVNETPSVKIPYANQIGYLNFDIFIPLTVGLDLSDIYTKDTTENLEIYLSENNIPFFSGVGFDEVDESYVTNSLTDLYWNENFDKGFVKNDVLNMSVTWGNKNREIITREFEYTWLEYSSNITFVNSEEEFKEKQKFRISWLREHGIESTYEWMEYLVSGEDSILEDAIKGTSKRQYIKNLKESFIKEFTYGKVLSSLNENDVNFFLNRFQYMYDIYDSYVSDITKSDIAKIINIYQTILEVLRLKTISGYASASKTMNVNISELANKSELMYLRNTFI